MRPTDPKPMDDDVEPNVGEQPGDPPKVSKARRTDIPPVGKFTPEERSDKTELIEDVKGRLERREL